jgi:hypothetical protein
MQDRHTAAAGGKIDVEMIYFYHLREGKVAEFSGSRPTSTSITRPSPRTVRPRGHKTSEYFPQGCVNKGKNEAQSRK